MELRAGKAEEGGSFCAQWKVAFLLFLPKRSFQENSSVLFVFSDALLLSCGVVSLLHPTC